MRAAIALGSNLDDRLSLLRAAKDRIRSLHDGHGPFLCSKIYETSPVDCPPGSPSFMNAVIELSTSLPPFDLLDATQTWERELGRPADHGFHTPRTIDLDLLYCGTHQISHPMLTLPHPRIYERLFVLAPLADVAPDHMVGPDSKAVRDLRDACITAKSESLKETSYYL